MLNLLFSPKGRINSTEFVKGAFVLIAAAFVVALLPKLSYALYAPLAFLLFGTLWCWIVLWIKRYHDAGQSGWMCLLPIAVFVVVGFIVQFFIQQMGLSGINPEIQMQIDEAAMAGDFGGVFRISMEKKAEIVKSTAVSKAFSGAALSLFIVFVFNAMIKGDPGDNQFGPKT